MAAVVPYSIPSGNEESAWSESPPVSGFNLELGPPTQSRANCTPIVGTPNASPCVSISPVWSNDGVTTEWEWTWSETTSRASQREVAIVVNLTDKLLKR